MIDFNGHFLIGFYCVIKRKSYQDAKNKEKASFAIIKRNRILKSETIPQTKEYFYEILKK